MNKISVWAYDYIKSPIPPALAMIATLAWCALPFAQAVATDMDSVTEPKHTHLVVTLEPITIVGHGKHASARQVHAP